MKKKKLNKKGLGLNKSKNESSHDLDQSTAKEKEATQEIEKKRAITKYLHPIFSKISIKKTNTPFSSYMKKDNQKNEISDISTEEETQKETEVPAEPDLEKKGTYQKVGSEDPSSLITDENQAEVEENADDSENDLGDDEIEEDKLAEVSEESPTEGENEQESEVFSERDGEDAGIDEDADSLVAKENLADVEENADDTENDQGDDEIEEDKLAEVSEESSTEGEK